MFFKRLSVLLVSAAMAGGLYAAESKPAPKAEERPDDRVCTIETPLGSHIKRRVCMTREQRDAQREADKKAMQDLRGRGNRTKAGSEPAGL